MLSGTMDSPDRLVRASRLASFWNSVPLSIAPELERGWLTRLSYICLPSVFQDYCEEDLRHGQLPFLVRSRAVAAINSYRVPASQSKSQRPWKSCTRYNS